MYYSQTFRTKWHDTDAFGYMRPSALLVYMQETANLQCKAYDMDLDRLHHEEGLGFLLSRLMLRVDAPLRAYEDIEVRTWCPPSKGMTFRRCFALYRDETLLSTAVSDWALMDLRARKLLRVSDFQREFPMGELPDENTLPRRVRIPAFLPMDDVGERRIMYSDIDFNHHMNNTRYPDMVCDFLPDMTGRWVRTLSLSYMREASYGDTLTVSRTTAPAPALDGVSETYLLRTTRPDGVVCLEAEVGLSELAVNPEV